MTGRIRRSVEHLQKNGYQFDAQENYRELPFPALNEKAVT